MIKLTETREITPYKWVCILTRSGERCFKNAPSKTAHVDISPGRAVSR
jgi:hypothetical protein